MPARSLTGVGPQRQLRAPNNEPFPMMKHRRQPPMLKYVRQFACAKGNTSPFICGDFISLIIILMTIIISDTSIVIIR